MVKINLNINNRLLYTIIVIFIILIAAGIVIGYGASTTPPSIHGHTGNEINISCRTHGASVAAVCTAEYPAYFGTIGKSNYLTCDDCGSCTYCNICCKLN